MQSVTFNQVTSLDRKEATELILTEKRRGKHRYADLAKAVGRHPVWVTSAIFGQQRMSEEEAAKLCTFLGLDHQVADALKSDPIKMPLDDALRADPLIYRLNEMIQTYGISMKALIEEEFGDGIMSAIDFDMDISREKNAAGDRVRITMSGKFLPYKKW